MNNTVLDNIDKKSEVISAIDNIDSTIMESEIDTCLAISKSYDKMLFIEEYYNGEFINEFSIFQEGKIMDDVKQQGKGMSTFKKIISFIPRLIKALIKSVKSKLNINDNINKLIKNEKKIDKYKKVMILSSIGVPLIGNIAHNAISKRKENKKIVDGYVKTINEYKSKEEDYQNRIKEIENKVYQLSKIIQMFGKTVNSDIVTKADYHDFDKMYSTLVDECKEFKSNHDKIIHDNTNLKNENRKLDNENRRLKAENIKTNRAYKDEFNFNNVLSDNYNKLKNDMEVYVSLFEKIANKVIIDGDDSSAYWLIREICKTDMNNNDVSDKIIDTMKNAVTDTIAEHNNEYQIQIDEYDKIVQIVSNTHPKISSNVTIDKRTLLSYDVERNEFITHFDTKQCINLINNITDLLDVVCGIYKNKSGGSNNLKTSAFTFFDYIVKAIAITPYTTSNITLKQFLEQVKFLKYECVDNLNKSLEIFESIDINSVQMDSDAKDVFEKINRILPSIISITHSYIRSINLIINEYITIFGKNELSNIVIQPINYHVDQK